MGKSGLRLYRSKKFRKSPQREGGEREWGGRGSISFAKIGKVHQMPPFSPGLITNPMGKEEKVRPGDSVRGGKVGKLQNAI